MTTSVPSRQQLRGGGKNYNVNKIFPAGEYRPGGRISLNASVFDIYHQRSMSEGATQHSQFQLDQSDNSDVNVTIAIDFYVVFFISQCRYNTIDHTIDYTIHTIDTIP